MSFRPDVFRGGSPFVSGRFARAALCLVTLPGYVTGLFPGTDLLDSSCPSIRDLSSELIGPPSPDVANSEGKPSVRVASYNIAHGKLGMRGIEKAIRTVEPDVIVLNEATSQNVASIVENFGLDADRQVATAYTMEAYGGDYGNVIITFGDFVVTSSVEIGLTVDEGMEERSMVMARVRQESTGTDFNVVGTHLTQDGKGLFGRKNNADVRLRQAADVRGLRQSLDSPVIVAGDMNSSKYSREYELLSAGLADPQEELGLSGVSYVTFPAIAWNRRVDHVLGEGIEPMGMGVAGGGGSDHCMVYVDFVPKQSLLE